MRSSSHSPSLLTFVLFTITTAASFMMLFYALLAATAPCAVLAKCYHGFHSAFSFDAHNAHYPTWMKELPDALNFSSLSVPGTHDTMTYNIGSDILQCQNWNLTVQLESGMRYFDIRARLRDNELQIYHGDGYTGHSYEEVLLDMFEFLDRNPSEAIVMRLKQEGGALGTNNTRNFEEAFNFYHDASPTTSPGSKKHIYAFNETAPLPTLGSLRSKIWILQNFPAASGDPNQYGLAWEGKQMILEDDYIVKDVAHLYLKWQAIEAALQKSSADLPTDNNTALYLAHVSASVGVLPIEAAAGPRNRTVQGMNDMTGQWLEEYEVDDKYGSRAGIVILDFPGKRLIDAILLRNEMFFE